MGRFSLAISSFLKRVVTEKYPYEPLELPEDFRGKPEIDENKCIACGACASVCPPSAIKVYEDEERKLKIVDLFLGRCIFCGRCEEVCPASAIKLSQEFELASSSSDDLHQIVELRMALCEECGKPFTTVRQLMEVAKKLSEEERRMLLLCPECRARRTGKFISYARW